MATDLEREKSLLLNVSSAIITNKTNKYAIKLKNSDFPNADRDPGIRLLYHSANAVCRFFRLMGSRRCFFVFIAISLYLFYFILFAFSVNLLHAPDVEDCAKCLFYLEFVGAYEKGDDKLAVGSPLR
jgi:hypothetical protein